MTRESVPAFSSKFANVTGSPLAASTHTESRKSPVSGVSVTRNDPTAWTDVEKDKSTRSTDAPGRTIPAAGGAITASEKIGVVEGKLVPNAAEGPKELPIGNK
jgi:hypothetical protein